MPPKKTAKKAISEKPIEETIVSKTNNPLVFISHDTRDAELAEEFSNLLYNASAGALNSFRSSDKKGTQGIEYGLDWYPAIMDKIDEASEVVCLLTQRSVDRPWILYEAGVAKGKLGKKVIGVAMGIQHSVAFTGPFAQFQNNDGSVEAITKLVVDLVCKVPGLNPAQSHVEKLVQEFHKRAGEIVKKNQTQPKKNDQDANENIVAKLFEEVKIMFENLPSRIENRIDPDSKRRRRRFHPRMFDEMLHMGSKFGDPSLGFLVIISFLKDEAPWLYEIGMETYRELKTAKNPIAKKKIISNFERASEMISHPFFMEFSTSRSEEMFMFSKEISHLMHKYFERFLQTGKDKE